MQLAQQQRVVKVIRGVQVEAQFRGRREHGRGRGLGQQEQVAADQLGGVGLGARERRLQVEGTAGRGAGAAEGVRPTYRLLLLLLGQHGQRVLSRTATQERLLLLLL